MAAGSQVIAHLQEQNMAPPIQPDEAPEIEYDVRKQLEFARELATQAATSPRVWFLHPQMISLCACYTTCSYETPCTGCHFCSTDATGMTAHCCWLVDCAPGHAIGSTFYQLHLHSGAPKRTQDALALKPATGRDSTRACRSSSCCVVRYLYDRADVLVQCVPMDEFCHRVRHPVARAHTPGARTCAAPVEPLSLHHVAPSAPAFQKNLTPVSCWLPVAPHTAPDSHHHPVPHDTPKRQA